MPRPLQPQAQQEGMHIAVLMLTMPQHPKQLRRNHLPHMHLQETAMLNRFRHIRDMTSPADDIQGNSADQAVVLHKAPRACVIMPRSSGFHLMFQAHFSNARKNNQLVRVHQLVIPTTRLPVPATTASKWIRHMLGITMSMHRPAK